MLVTAKGVVDRTVTAATGSGNSARMGRARRVPTVQHSAVCLEHVERLRVAGVAILTMDACAGVHRAAVLLQMSVPDPAVGNGLIVQGRMAVQTRALGRGSGTDCERNEQRDERAAKPPSVIPRAQPLSTLFELG